MTLERLDDYLSRALEGPEADAFEEALFDAAAKGDAETLAFLDRLRRTLADLAARGSFDITLSVAEAEALLRDSPLKVRVFDAEREANIDAERELRDADLVLFNLPVPLAGVQRVDLELGYGDKTVLTLPDIKVDREHDRVVLCCEGELARASMRPGSFTRLVAVERDERRTLALHRYAPAAV